MIEWIALLRWQAVPLTMLFNQGHPSFRGLAPRAALCRLVTNKRDEDNFGVVKNKERWSETLAKLIGSEVRMTENRRRR